MIFGTNRWYVVPLRFGFGFSFHPNATADLVSAERMVDRYGLKISLFYAVCHAPSRMRVHGPYDSFSNCQSVPVR
jgi:hypothetical protein